MKLISLGSVLSVGVLAMAACTSGGEETTGDGDGDGDAATGGVAGDGDGDGVGGTPTGDGDGDGAAVACLPALEADLLDFTYDDSGMGGALPSAVDGEFGDYTTTLSGGTFVYGAASGGLTSDVTGDNWHISGSVADYSGFGVFFANCTKADLSAYKGITLTISGNAGTSPITMSVGTAANEITSAWLEENGGTDVVPNFGRCTPTTGQYDGSCAAPTTTITVGNSPETVEILWADLTGGAPDASVTPSEITAISWYFAWTEGGVAYDVDITIDDIGLIP